MYRDTSLGHVKVLDLTTPLYAQMELTRGCNYRCFMCYNVWWGGYRLGPQLTQDQHYRVLDTLSPHLFSMVFSGGEPTLIPWLPCLVERCRMANVDCSLISNGERITPALARALVEAGLQGVQISLHHFDREVSDQITGVNDSVGKTLRGAQNIMALVGQDAVGICMVVNKTTVRDVYRMGEFLHSQGFSQFVVGVLSYSGRAAVNNLRIGVDDLRDIHQQLQELYEDLGLSVGFTGGMPFCVLPEGWKESPVEIHNTCDAAIHQIVVGPDGECRPCVEYPIGGGNILTESLERIWASEPFELVRTFRNVPPSCADCHHVSICHGGCRAAALALTGDICSLDPFLVGG